MRMTVDVKANCATGNGILWRYNNFHEYLDCFAQGGTPNLLSMA